MSDRPEQIALFIDRQKFEGWEGVDVNLSIDNLTRVSFKAPFEPSRKLFRDTFRPFVYRDLEVHLGENPLFTGTLVGVDPGSDEKSNTVQVSAYSTPGVLADVPPPIDALPLEFNGLTLRQIAERLLEPFGIEVEVDGDDGAEFPRVAIETDQKILEFLADLAKQRGLVIADTPKGALRFLRSASPGRPVARLREGEAPLMSATATFSPQRYFSEITGIAKTRAGKEGSSYTVRNPWARGFLRPMTFATEDTDPGDLPAVVEAKMGRMFANVASYEVEVPTWRDAKGNLWWPNTTVTLEAPGAMVYRETELIVRDVVLKSSKEGDHASLGLVLPGAFSGEIPQQLPWEE